MISGKSSCESAVQGNSPDVWPCIVFVAGGISLLVDTLFMYVRSISSPNFLYMDWQLGVRIVFIRSIADIIFSCDIALKFRSAFKPTNLRTELVKKEKNYLKSSFMIDLLAVLPLAQFLLWRKSDRLVVCVMAQIPFKFLAVSPYRDKTIKKMGILTKNAWFGALQNLFYFIMISNGLGAIYYDGYITALKQCGLVVNGEESTDAATHYRNKLTSSCTEKYGKDLGFYSDAVATKIGTRSFIQKYTYCLAWGLKSLSSFGQIFGASSYAMDTVQSLLICVFGLVLFGDLLARMQTALQCTEVKEDRQRVRQRMAEKWMEYHQLPQPLKKKVEQAIQSEWSTTRGINDEAILESLPWDTRTDIRRHLYLEIIQTMPLFQKMDKDLVHALCGYFRTFSSNKGAYVAFAGEPVRQMLFIYDGQLEVLDASSGGQCLILGPGDLCGKELLYWCSQPTRSTDNLIPATHTIKCTTDVDAFALRVDELKLLAIQFHRNGKFCRAFQPFAA